MVKDDGREKGGLETMRPSSEFVCDIVIIQLAREKIAF